MSEIKRALLTYGHGMKAYVMGAFMPTSLLPRFIHSVNQQHAKLHFTLVKNRLKTAKEHGKS
jgi:hypothetical protein